MVLGQLFSQRVGYAVHALCYMANSPNGCLATASELADWMRQVWPGTSETYLADIIRRLVPGGILASQRGIFGGYRLARDPEEISLRDVVALLEGFSLSRCALTPNGKCNLQGNCSSYRRLRKLQEEYAELLSKVSIADLARDMAAEVPQKEPA